MAGNPAAGDAGADAEFIGPDYRPTPVAQDITAAQAQKWRLH